MTSIPLPQTDEPDLATIIRTYNEVTERLKESHEMLRLEVCRLRDELQEKNKALERRERLAALGEMAAGVAHEIRNPLGGIGLYASLLERDLADRPPQLDIARHIGVGVRNMERIVGDILAFAGGAEPNRQVARFGDILDSVLVQTSPRAEEVGARLHLDGGPAEVELSCDAPQIERALINLVLNALDAVEGGGHVWIGATRSSNGERLSIAVEDDGPGVPSGMAQRVFNPFFTTKDTGTGLGLAIVHRIAESHGGSITVGNREGGGASFVLGLPIGEHGTDVREQVEPQTLRSRLDGENRRSGRPGDTPRVAHGHACA